MFWSSLISLDSQAGRLLFISEKENIFQRTRRYCCFAMVGRHLCSAASQVMTFPNYVRGYLGKQHEPLQIVTRSETISNCSGWIGNPADAQIQQLVTLFLCLSSFWVVLLWFHFQLDWWWLLFVRYRILVFHQFCVTCFWLVFFKSISIKSLGVKGYSFYFLTTVNDMVSQKKWGENFSFPVVCLFSLQTMRRHRNEVTVELRKVRNNAPFIYTHKYCKPFSVFQPVDLGVLGFNMLHMDVSH